MKYNRVLSIAGSDSGGGAGIQADIKSISANGSFAMTAVTAITSQNTVGVQGVYPLPAEVVESQIDSVMTDIGVDSVKIGMLHSAEIIKIVAKTLAKYNAPNIVLDPVMVATSGDSLFQQEALEALKGQLIPIATLITPNLPEAAVLLGRQIETVDQMKVAAKELSSEGKISVFIKGGHLETESELCDVLFDARTGLVSEFYSTKIDTPNTHGTGCTISSAIAAYLSQGFTLLDSVKKAKEYITKAIESGSQYEVGKGHGPVNHFCK